MTETKQQPAKAADPSAGEIESLESLLRKLPQEDQAEAFRILYGDVPSELSIPPAAEAIAREHDFEVAAYSFPAAKEQRRAARPVVNAKLNCGNHKKLPGGGLGVASL